MSESNATIVVPARRLFEFEALFIDLKVYLVSTDFDDNPIMLASNRSVDSIQNGDLTDVKTYVIQKFGDQIVSTQLITSNPGFFSAIQLLSGGRFLAAHSRCRRPQPNVFIFDKFGREMKSFIGGDAIECLQVSKNDDIWISYFDEGALTNEPGIACFNENGQLTFDFYEAKKTHNLPAIADCYAMNVVSEHETWCYYYPDFSMLQLKDKDVSEFWPEIPLKGAHGFAINGNTVLFGPGYTEKNCLSLLQPGTGVVATLLSGQSFYDKSCLSLLQLGTDVIETLKPVDDKGNVLEITDVWGRGSSLFLLSKKSLFRVGIADITKARQSHHD